MVANLFTSYYSHTFGKLLSLKIGQTSVTFTSSSKKDSPTVCSIFHWNLILWYSKHTLSHCEGSQNCMLSQKKLFLVISQVLTKLQLPKFWPNVSLKILTKIQPQNLDQTPVSNLDQTSAIILELTKMAQQNHQLVFALQLSSSARVTPVKSTKQQTVLSLTMIGLGSNKKIYK